MRKRKSLFLKMLGILLVLIIAFGSVRVVFADGDIATMLSNWFDNKRIQAINEIESSLSQEQAEQTTRLKSEIQHAINAAEQQYQDFLENEKAKRTLRLQEYADQLIENYDVKVDSGSEVAQKLECIASNAEIEMDIVLGKKGKSALKDCGELTINNNNIESEEVVSDQEVESEKENDNESKVESEEMEEDSNEIVDSAS